MNNPNATHRASDWDDSNGKPKGPQRGDNGLWYWPNGSPVTHEDLEHITPQIVPRETEIHRGPRPGIDFEIPTDTPPARTPRHHPLIGPTRGDIDNLLNDPPPFNA